VRISKLPPDAPERLVKRTFALLREARISDRRDRIDLFRWILHDPSVSSTNDLNEAELETVVNMLSTWSRQGELESRSREAIGRWRSGQEE